MPSLEGKIVLITGSGRTMGLGHAMAVALASAGARIALVDINREGLEESAEDVRKAGGKDAALPIVADVTSAQEAEGAVQRTIAAMGGLHVLINNAGINLFKAGVAAGNAAPFWEVPPEAWARMIQVNVNGPYHMARAAVGHLTVQRWGRIIGVTTSLDTMIRGAGMPYGPTKAAHEAFIAGMAQQLEGTGVTANVLVPGGSTYTGFQEQDGGRELLQREVMQAPAAWLASEESDGFTGRRIVARLWDASLPLAERLEKASAPAGWPQLGRQAFGR